MKTRTEPRSGKCGKIVAVLTRFGQTERPHTPPTNRATAPQCRARSDFGCASSLWSGLTEEQWAAWDAAGKQRRSRPRLGQSGTLTGQNLFTEINTNQALIGEDLLLYPPERPRFEPNPIVRLVINTHRGRIRIKLMVPKAPAAHILVYGAAPCNAGRRFCKDFTYLGLLPAPVAGQCDITRLYLMKFGLPRPGSRIIIRTRQQVNGWRDAPARIDAIVPGGPSPAALLRRPPATGAAS